MDHLLTKFKETEIKYKALKEQLNRGEISTDQAKDEIKKLMIPDDTGVYWMMGGKSGKWYKHVEGQWQEADPFSHFAPPPAPEVPQPQVEEPQIETAQVEQEYQIQDEAALEQDYSHKAQAEEEESSSFSLDDYKEDSSAAQNDEFKLDSVRQEQESDNYQWDQGNQQDQLDQPVQQTDPGSYEIDEQDMFSQPKASWQEGAGFLDTHGELNKVDTNEFVIKQEQQQMFAEKSGDIGINIDLDRELTSGDAGGIDEDFVAQQTSTPQVQEEEDDNPFIGQDSGEFSLDQVDQDTREKERDTLDDGSDQTVVDNSFATANWEDESQYSQDTFHSRETVVEDNSVTGQLEEEESAFDSYDSSKFGDTFSLEDSQTIEESPLEEEPKLEEEPAIPEVKPVPAGVPAVDFSNYVECVACKSKIQPIALHCPFCGANQKDFNPNKKKSKKKPDTGTEGELVIKSIKILSFLFFLGGLGIICGVIFGAIFGVLSNTMQSLHQQLPMMFQEVRGGFVGGLIFAATGGIAGFVVFAVLSVILSTIYNLISFVFGGIRFKTKG